MQVEYQMEGFTEKNKDTVFEEHVNILKASQVLGGEGGVLKKGD